MYIENNSIKKSNNKEEIFWCSESTFPSCEYYKQQENMAPRGKIPTFAKVMKHRKIIKKVVKGSKILGKLGLTGANIALSQTDNRDNWAIPGQPYGPGNMAQIGIERNMIEPPKDIIFSELKTKIEEKLNKIEAENRGYEDYYKRFQRALRLSYYFYYQIKQIVNLQYAGKEVPQENLPNLKNIEVTLEADNMSYKSLD